MYDYVGLRVRLDGEVERRGRRAGVQGDIFLGAGAMRIVPGLVTIILVAVAWAAWQEAGSSRMADSRTSNPAQAGAVFHLAIVEN